MPLFTITEGAGRRYLAAVVIAEPADFDDFTMKAL